MSILVDTSIWSAVLRRKNPDQNLVQVMHKLVTASSVSMIGPIRQEILSGVKDPLDFQRLKKALSNFRDITLDKSYYELAAKIYNLCRSKGVQGSNTDFLICAVSIKNRQLIFTSDKDFNNFRKYLKIKLFEC